MKFLWRGKGKIGIIRANSSDSLSLFYPSGLHLETVTYRSYNICQGGSKAIIFHEKKQTQD